MTHFTLSHYSENLVEDLTMDSLGVTGALLFNEGRFLQVLDGGEADVRAICELLLRLLSLDGGAGAGSGLDSKDGPAL